MFFFLEIVYNLNLIDFFLIIEFSICCFLILILIFLVVMMKYLLKIVLKIVIIMNIKGE